MDIQRTIRSALDLAVSIEDRNVGSELRRLAENLHVLYFDPQTTVPILRELAEHGRLSTMTRSDALGRFRYGSAKVAEALTQLEDFLQQHGRSIFSPSEYAELASYGTAKRQLRSNIGASLDRDVRFAIDEMIKLPSRYPAGQEPYEAIKAQALVLLSHVENSNARLDTAFRTVTAAASAPRAQTVQPRWPKFRWLNVVLVIFALLAAVVWYLFRDAATALFSTFG